jgi:hypothetical protein
MPHELIRLFLVEQVYRAHTILKGEKYHHDWSKGRTQKNCHPWKYW